MSRGLTPTDGGKHPRNTTGLTRQWRKINSLQETVNSKTLEELLWLALASLILLNNAAAFHSQACPHFPFLPMTEPESEIQHLESLYQRKLAALDELKKLLLHQAFSGAL